MPVRVLADVLWDAGIRRCVVSPGSRNAPIILELSRMGFDMLTVIDERTAAFVALGMAKALGKPVVVVCTSGTAALNLAPALAEAYYSHTPLIAVTADRPEADIDQYMGQTIRQNEALQAVVRCSVAIGEDMGVEWVNRLVNNAVWTTRRPVAGPAQINVHLSLPLTETCSAPIAEGHSIDLLVPKTDMSDLALPFAADSRILVLVGSDIGSDIRPTVSALAASQGVLILAEIQSNLPGACRMAHFSGNRAHIEPPDVAVVVGGSFVDPSILKKLAEWYTPVVTAGLDAEPVTRGLNVVAHYPMPVADFFRFLAEKVIAAKNYQCECKSAPYEGHPIIDNILNALPPQAATFIANGMCIRHAQHSPRTDLHVMTNRGVSGIDGCTSTAVGAAMAQDMPLFLISGDMGAFYDIGALAVDGLPAGFHMFVIDNGGGDIFRHVATTASLPPNERERFFVAPPKAVLADYARNCGVHFSEINADGLSDAVLSAFITAPGPAILNIKTTQ